MKLLKKLREDVNDYGLLDAIILARGGEIIDIVGEYLLRGLDAINDLPLYYKDVKMHLSRKTSNN